MAEPKSELKIDMEAFFALFTRSKAFEEILLKICEEIAQEAEAIARAVAYDEGWYAAAFRFGVLDADEARRFASTGDAGRNRARRGQKGTSRYLDWELTGSPDDSYQGRLGIVTNINKKAVWIEYGSISNAPERVLWTACERVAARYGLETEVLWAATHQPDPEKLGQLQSEGKAKLAAARESGGRA